jgi:ERCC4-type nuclease
MIEILCDDRERAIIPHMEENVDLFEIDYRVKRLQTSDYAICIDGKLVAIIERKTWNDLASSMRDGRKGNIRKLLHVREQYGCRIFYIIEGNPNRKKFGRIPKEYLISHLDHISFRDSISIIYTGGPIRTANRLFELAKNISTLKTFDDIKGGNPEEILSENLSIKVPICQKVL